ncbi:Calcium-transporting ATPase 5, plasma membrane-type [Asimina triloba]
MAAVASLVLGIKTEVVRGGRRIDASIYDLVVGDVVPLKIGDQVPADGILISGHSLEIDESSMTGESGLVRKDQRAPFLMSGCKVADGYGTMLHITVTGIKHFSKKTCMTLKMVGPLVKCLMMGHLTNSTLEGILLSSLS